MEPNYYAVIPHFVLDSPDLSDAEKLFYGRIAMMTSDKGFCWASNAFFAQKLGVDESTISRRISRLQKLGFVVVKISQSAGNQRNIFLGKPRPLSAKLRRPSTQNCGEGVGKIAYRNNQLNNQLKYNYERAENENFEMPGTAGTPSTHGDWIASKGAGGAARLFAETEFSDLRVFEQGLAAGQGIVAGLDVEHYWRRCRDWSKRKEARSHDWIATARHFVEQDAQRGNLKLKNAQNHVPPNAKSGRTPRAEISPNSGIDAAAAAVERGKRVAARLAAKRG